MKKVIVTIGIYCAACSISQAQSDSITISPSVKTGLKTIKIEEINFIGSYYNQTGKYSPVTGGIGSEALFDVAGALDISISMIDKKQRKNTLSIDGALDYYSSASSDMIDSRTASSASKTDLHVYPSIAWNRKDEKKKYTIGASLAYSTEWDYKSYGGSASVSKLSADNNTEFTVRAGIFLDKWMIILPHELRPVGYPSGSGGDQDGLEFKPRNSYNVSLGISQVINKRLHMMAMIEPSYQEGLLSTPFHRVYFTNNALKVEKLPGTRIKLPVSIRASYFLGDNIVLRSFYRFYRDDWGMVAHTVSGEASVKISSFLSITPHYRFNSQSSVRYFKPYKSHAITESFYTNDYDISSFNSAFWGAGVRLAPPGGILGIRFLQSIEARYGHYNRTNGLQSDIGTISIKMKP